MPNTRDLRRRICGAIFLLAAIAMLVAGQTFLSERLRAHSAAFLIFWMICFVLLGFSVLVAILDLAIVRRRLREEQRSLLENTIREIEHEKSARRRSRKNSK